jgi:hypothetical protein
MNGEYLSLMRKYNLSFCRHFTFSYNGVGDLFYFFVAWWRMKVFRESGVEVSEHLPKNLREYCNKFPLLLITRETFCRVANFFPFSSSFYSLSTHPIMNGLAKHEKSITMFFIKIYSNDITCDIVKIWKRKSWLRNRDSIDHKKN